MASKEIVVYLTGGIKDFFVRKGGEKTVDCISKHFRFIHTQPFFKLKYVWKGTSRISVTNDNISRHDDR